MLIPDIPEYIHQIRCICTGDCSAWAFPQVVPEGQISFDGQLLPGVFGVLWATKSEGDPSRNV